MEASLRIAYLTSAFARPSDTFIRNEVNELRRLGATVDTYSVRRPPIDADADADPDAVAHQKSTDFILEAGLVSLAAATLRMALTHPNRFARTLKLAWRTAADGAHGAFRQAAYFVEANYLATRLLARRTQILHNHIGESSATVAMLASELSGIPFSLTIHGPYVFYGPRQFALGEKLVRAAFTACISDFCRGQCQVFAPQSAWPKLHVVRCSVQPMFVEEPPPHAALDHAHFVCVARLNVEKGQRLLIEAAKQLLAEPSGTVPSFPSPRGKMGRAPSARGWSPALGNIQVSIIGDGPDRAALEQAIRDAGLASNITILGWQSSRAIRDALLNATALVIPSLAEGLPIVAMEALASRCPVIATNIAAMSELIEPGKNGWLIPSGSVDALAAALIEAAHCDDKCLQQLGDNGRARVLELHHPARQTEQLLGLLSNAAIK